MWWCCLFVPRNCRLDSPVAAGLDSGFLLPSGFQLLLMLSRVLFHCVKKLGKWITWMTELQNCLSPKSANQTSPGVRHPSFLLPHANLARAIKLSIAWSLTSHSLNHYVAVFCTQGIYFPSVPHKDPSSVALPGVIYCTDCTWDEFVFVIVG